MTDREREAPDEGAEEYAYRVDMDGREAFRAGWDAARAFLASSPSGASSGGSAQKEKRYTLAEVELAVRAANESPDDGVDLNGWQDLFWDALKETP